MRKTAILPRMVPWVGPAITATVFLVYLVWSWGKWPDALIDFGRELYIPWQLAEGKHLYADIAYFNGPLSPSFNALVFTICGTSLRTLAWVNVVITALIAFTIHVLLRIVCDRFVATVGTLAFFVFFAFAQFMPSTNYNYIAPYSHEMIHGTLLATASLLLLALYLRRGESRLVAAMGATVGLTFLTKAEFVIALVPAIAVGIALHRRYLNAPPRSLSALVSFFVVGALVPPAVAFLLLLRHLPADRALMSLLGPWPHIFDNEITQLRFYREIRGTLDLGASLRRIGLWSLRYAIALLPAAVAGFALRRGRPGKPWVVLLLAAVTAALVLVGREGRDFENLANPFPLVLLCGMLALAVSLRRGTADVESRSRQLLSLSCLVYAFGLLTKMMLNTRILHYGFALAMPAGVAIVALMLGGVPEWLDRRGRAGRVFRVLSLVALASFGLVQVQATAMWLERRTVAVGSGADKFLIHPQDAAFVEVLDRIESLRAPGEEMLVIPEGVMLNYLTRMVNPTGHVNFMPPELIMFGEDRILEAFVSGSPDWVVLFNRGATEYGYRMLGDDYGASLISWVEANYRVVDRVFEPTPHGQRPFAAILRRNGEE